MHPDRAHYDAVVVGARAAGAATAMLLARAGARVLVVDRSHYGADTLSTHALMRGGVLQLHRWGLLDRIVDAGTPAIRRTTFRYADGDVTVTIKPSARRRRPLRPTPHPARPRPRRRRHRGRRRRALRHHRHRRLPRRHRSRHRHRRPRRNWPPVRHRRLRRDRCRRAAFDDRRAGGRSDRTRRHRGRRGRVRLLVRHRHRRLRMGLPARFAAGLIPTQRRPHLRVRRQHTGPHRPRRTQALDDVVRHASPTIAERARGRHAPAGVRSFGGRPGYLRRAWGPGWALVGDAGCLEGPHQRPRPHRRPARRRAARPRHHRHRQRRPRRRDALAAYQATRDHLTLPLLTTADAIAGYRWNEDQIGPLLVQLTRPWPTRWTPSPPSMRYPSPDLGNFRSVVRGGLHSDRLAQATRRL